MRRVASSLAQASRQLARAVDTAPALQRLSRSFADDGSLLKTPLYDFHVENGGKMVPFAGWSMPIQYKDSIMDSTKNCRENAALFDVSHMCGLTLTGKDAIPFLEKLVVGDIKALKDGTGTLSVFTNEQGGIIDDSVITKVSSEEVYLVVNAGRRDRDLQHIGDHLREFKATGAAAEMHLHDDRCLLALQGPAAMGVLQPMTDLDLSKFFFSNFAKVDVSGIPCLLTRTGYTGEDGFEISVPATHVQKLTEALLADRAVKLAGLGARDALRLEAGLCLYGNDLDETTTPVEASLSWTIAKSRREACDFLGGDVIKQQLANGVTRRRVGFVSTGAPARQHSKILTQEGEEIGEVTSGAFSPMLRKNVGMGYVATKYAKSGTELKVVVRTKQNDMTIQKMPFVSTTYFKG